MAIPDYKLVMLRALLIAAAGCWVFAPALQGDWLMDDDMYLTQNVLLHDPARLWKIWFAPGSLIEYYPVEATVQAVQWHFWHRATPGYHLTNVLLHILSGLLVWRLLAKFGLRLAWLGGFLFVVHPVAVESVAWISELKNTLSLPPFLLAMIAWIDYDARRQSRDWFLALGFFVLAMLCKISMATFPFVMLLYAWWRRDRVGWGDVKAAAPFFVVSLVLGLVTTLCGGTYQTARQQFGINPVIGGLASHLALAGWSIAAYFAKCCWPVHLLFIYPQWPIEPGAITSYLPWVVLVITLAWLWSRRATWGRHVLLGLGYFLITLAPFVGFISVSYMRFTWVMDHFLYLPMIGLIGLAIAALGDIQDRLPKRWQPALAGATAVVLAILALGSHQYAETFDGPEALWSYTVAHNPGAFLAHNNLGNVLLETGRAPGAIAEYEKAIELNPGMPEAQNNLGFALEESGRMPEAIGHFEQAVQLNPHFYIAQLNLADALAQTGQAQEAIKHYQAELELDPQNQHAREAMARLEGQSKAP
jgi:hypothetical protein